MKKVVVCIALVTLGFGFSSFNFPGNNERSDSKEALVESKFKINYQENDKKLKVEISGNTDPMASLSITNQRGSSILFTLVEAKNQEVEFNVSQLGKGIYNVMFITNDEIRIKRLEIK